MQIKIMTKAKESEENNNMNVDGNKLVGFVFGIGEKIVRGSDFSACR